MKKFISSAISISLTLLLVICLVGCKNDVKAEGLWENATYTSDTTLGEGAKSVTLSFEIGEDKITFTLKTDKETLGEALAEHDLIEGENGLYTKVNGVVADYNIDKSYWLLYIDGDYAMTGLDDTQIDESVVYSIVYTK